MSDLHRAANRPVIHSGKVGFRRQLHSADSAGRCSASASHSGQFSTVPKRGTGTSWPFSALVRAIGGLKVVTDNDWFAARPSDTEDVYKLYAERFDGEAHLKRIQQEAKALVDDVLAG